MNGRRDGTATTAPGGAGAPPSGDDPVPLAGVDGPPPPDVPDPLDLLTYGELTVEGRLTDASNLTLRCGVRRDGREVRCVYKPVSGERPLWDFPDRTLAGREVAAYLVSRETGWSLVPPTVLRDGPFGPGSCQLWIDPADREPLVGFVPDDRLPSDWHPVAAAVDPEGRRYTLAHADDPRLARMAVFDAVVNNADRKGGHLLESAGATLYGVDNGLCFHPEPKLRTVLWGWADRPLPDEVGPVLERLAAAVTGELGETLTTYLSEAEVAALADRIDSLRRRGRFPLPDPAWPAVPWPPI